MDENAEIVRTVMQKLNVVMEAEHCGITQSCLNIQNIQETN
jgi:hypothetical protein